MVRLALSCRSFFLMYSQTRRLPFRAALLACTPVLPDVVVAFVAEADRLVDAALLAGADFVRVAMQIPPESSEHHNCGR